MFALSKHFCSNKFLSINRCRKCVPYSSKLKKQQVNLATFQKKTARFSVWQPWIFASIISFRGTFMRLKDIKPAQPSGEDRDPRCEFESWSLRFILWREWWNQGLMNWLFGLSWEGVLPHNTQSCLCGYIPTFRSKLVNYLKNIFWNEYFMSNRKSPIIYHNHWLLFVSLLPFGRPVISEMSFG